MIQEDFFKFILEEAPAYIFLYREKFIYANRSALDALGYTLEEAKNLYVWDIVHPSYKDIVKELVKKRIKGEKIDKKYSDLKVITKDGKILTFRLYATTVKINGLYGGLAIGVDITKEKELEKQLKKEKEKIDTILKNSYDIVLIVDFGGRIKFRIPKKDSVLNFDIEELYNKPVTEILHPKDIHIFLSAKEKAIKNKGKIFFRQYRAKTKDGKYKWIEGIFHLPKNWNKLGLEGVIVNERDITDKVKTEEELFKKTYYDQLTNLPNKTLFLEKIKDKLKTNKGFLALVVIDIARFREINSTFGIEFGDKLLREISLRLKDRFKTGIISRLHSDEFVLALNSIKSKDEIENIVYQIKDIFEQPFFIGNKQIYISSYAGVSIFPIDGKKVEDLLRKANVAVSRAKEIGENTISFYSKVVEHKISRNVFLKQELKKAFENEDFVIFFQPIVNLKNKKIIGIESLIRWKHRRFGIIPPSEFIQIVESMDLIYKIGEFVLDGSLYYLSELRKQGFEDIQVAVNFSTKQFSDKDLIDKIFKTLDKYRINPEHFVLEITEETAMREPEETQRILRVLKKEGVKIAIDDFGTGYSSMRYLIDFDIDKIKIDKGFILPLIKYEKSLHIVKAIIKLAHSIGASALAEGIETEQHYQKLLSLGCDEGQGFYFAKPMPFEELIEFLKTNN